ncbi:MAG TPA: hypothetical protein VG370_24710 [Chloroflexota bacterium]|nr:hypothetical protein [Chloroflexota bacterium]
MPERSRWLVDKSGVVSDEAIVATMHPWPVRPAGRCSGMAARRGSAWLVIS